MRQTHTATVHDMQAWRSCPSVLRGIEDVAKPEPIRGSGHPKIPQASTRRDDSARSPTSMSTHSLALSTPASRLIPPSSHSAALPGLDHEPAYLSPAPTCGPLRLWQRPRKPRVQYTHAALLQKVCSAAPARCQSCAGCDLVDATVC
jgi:hypothetical protein